MRVPAYRLPPTCCVLTQKRVTSGLPGYTSSCSLLFTVLLRTIMNHILLVPLPKSLSGPSFPASFRCSLPLRNVSFFFSFLPGLLQDLLPGFLASNFCLYCPFPTSPLEFRVSFMTAFMERRSIFPKGTGKRARRSNTTVHIRRKGSYG